MPGTDKCEKKKFKGIKSAKKNYYPTKMHHPKHSNISQGCTRIKAFCGLEGKSSSLGFLSICLSFCYPCYFNYLSSLP